MYVSLYKKGCALHMLKDGLAIWAVWKGRKILTITLKNVLPLSLNHTLHADERNPTNRAPNFSLPQVVFSMDTVIEVSTYC